MADHNNDFYVSHEHLQDDVAQNLATVDDFRTLVDCWTDSFTSKLWRCFGCLTASNCTERKRKTRFGKP
jgi:hypothetical protein